MIPKKIHYCWFGGAPLPELAQKCIASWRKYLPEYEIIRWDETNFPIDEIPYTRDAYNEKKYAFVSDYARFVILHTHGGLYFDTDVEIINPLDDIIAAGPFMGAEQPSRPGLPPESLDINPGLGLASTPGHPILSTLISTYRQLSFYNPDGTLNQQTIVRYTTDLLIRHGLRNTPDIQQIDGITIYPVDYFCPLSVTTGRLTITPNTRSIHHFAKTWLSRKDRLYMWLTSHIGPTATTRLYTSLLYPSDAEHD